MVFNDKYGRFIEDYKNFLSISSISSDSAYKKDIYKAADWLKSYLIEVGFNNAKLLETDRYPVVYAQNLNAGSSAPTILVYGHYDVQPPDPIEEWKTDPFDAHVEDQLIYARGASDMKGQIMIALAAIQSVNAIGKLPVNIKCFIEGEEEIGSPSIENFLKSHQELLKAAFVLNLDAGMLNQNTPTIVYGLRGLAYFELIIKGPAHDLHSGLFGGIIYNPAQALCEIIAGMKDKNGKITLPGYYDSVVPISEEEKQQLSKLNLGDEYYLEQTGSRAIWGEQGYTSVERIGARPTLDINGILAGYTGEGPKTVIPATALAKISMRLVPNQTPEIVHEQLLDYLEKNAPSQIHWELKRLASDPACLVDPNHYAAKCFGQALYDTWGQTPILKREGGSIPIVSHMKNILGLDTVLSGFGLPEDRIHSPNERMHLPTWKKGVEAVIRFINYLNDFYVKES